MKADGVQSRNAVATAEGAIAEALQAGTVSIQGSRSLVVGYGTCGAVLASKLDQWKSEVTVLDRTEEKRERARSYGYQAHSFSEAEGFMGEYDLIFNTVPAPVLTEELLESVKPGVTIIDIASDPGGVDFAYCEKRGICAKLCLGLPGKYAPKSAAGILMEVITKTILGD
jgi:dipicolinate synthase subunit A